MTVVEQVVDLPGVTIFEVPDNLDSTFYSPRLFRAFCLPLLRQAAAMIHARGKYLFIHACGRLKALAPLIFESGLDCVEGQAHPPLGDWHLHEARALSPRLILCGGMTANEQQWRGPGTARRIDDFVRGLLDSLGDRRRFVLASGCNTSPHTPIENLIAFRDAAWKYGRFT
jgi:uroporphyrinogen-III decarboxylase